MADSPLRLHALVTGGSRGIGAAISRALAGRGCRVALHYHQNEAAAAATLAALDGGGHACFAADLGAAGAAPRLWSDVSAVFGRIDLLINNAGIYLDHPPLACDAGAWRDACERTLALNLMAPALLCHLAARAMAAAGGGRIVNVSSRGAFRGEPGAPAYAASKAGLNALGQSLAQALAPSGVLVFAVAPGWVETDMAAAHLAGPHGAGILAQHPLGRVTTAAEVAAAVEFCALTAPPAMTGAILDVNGASYLRT